MNSLLKFENITFSYEGNLKPALKNLSISIPIGKKCALLGQNGSGKSTVLLLANGLLKPSKGTMFWRGEMLEFKKAALKQYRRKTGLLFQNADEMLLSPTVSEDLCYGLMNAGYRGEELQVKLRNIVKNYGLVDIEDSPIHHLSLGEKRRVALAGIVGLEPELLLLDEPTTYLDPLQTEVFLKELHNIHQSGTTVVMSTHDLDLAYEWADWVFVIENGSLVFEGKPDDLFENEKFVLEKGLSLPLLFQLKQIVAMAAGNKMKQRVTKEELLQSIQDLLNKEGL